MNQFDKPTKMKTTMRQKEEEEEEGEEAEKNIIKISPKLNENRLDDSNIYRSRYRIKAFCQNFRN